MQRISRDIPRRSKRLKRSLKETNLLALPDEALSLIMRHLNSGNSSGTFQEPRHAFSLAMTNTRLLAVFRETIIRIIPDLSNPTPATLSSRHILAVSRLAGANLRELHFTDCFDDTLEYISSTFPRLEVLSFHDRRNLCRDGLREILESFSFRSLSVTSPTPELLGNIAAAPTPSELSLYNVNKNGFRPLARILNMPPRELIISLQCSADGPNFPNSFHMLLEVLVKVLPEIEALAIMPVDEEGGGEEGFAERAARLITEARRNSRESVCQSIKVSGQVFFNLLKAVNKTAVIEISDCRDSYFGPGPGNDVYPTKLVLDQHFVERDVSQLEEVTVTDTCRMCVSSWKNLLSEVTLKSVFVLDLRSAKSLSLKTEVLEIPISLIKRNRQWSWLGDAGELNLVGEEALDKQEQLNFFRGVTSMLRFFRGRVLWVNEMEPAYFTVSCEDLQTSRALRGLINAVKKFEKGNGDAGTVKTMIDCILTRWSMEPSDL